MKKDLRVGADVADDGESACGGSKSLGVDERGDRCR